MGIGVGVSVGFIVGLGVGFAVGEGDGVPIGLGVFDTCVFWAKTAGSIGLEKKKKDANTKIAKKLTSKATILFTPLV